MPLLASTVLGALPLARFGSMQQQGAWLGRLVEGRALLSGALPLSPLEPLSAQLPRVASDAAGPRIDGTHPTRRAPPEVYAAADIGHNVAPGPRRMDGGTMLALQEQPGSLPKYDGKSTPRNDFFCPVLGGSG